MCTLAQADTLKPMAGYIPGVVPAMQFEWQHDVFKCGQVCHQMERLKDEAAQLPPLGGTLILIQRAEGLACEQDFSLCGNIESSEKTK